MKVFLVLLIATGAMAPHWKVQAQDVGAVTQETQERIDHFILRMKDWGYYYGDLAGTKLLPLSYDDDTRGGNLYIEGGDWAVFDQRLCSGAYGVSHDDGSIFQVELTRPDAHDVACLSPGITSQVDAITLMQRYQWFHALFIDWAHVRTPTPLRAGGWDGFADIEASYELEKPDLAGDPHLALYWLMHFGFTLDDRYRDVKRLVTENNLAQRLEFIDNAVAFFDHRLADQDIAISNSYTDEIEFESVYLKRRAYLVFVSRSYKYASGAEGLNAWWSSITLYPNAERYMVRRIRWLANNLKEHDAWQSFGEILAEVPEPEAISLLSYVLALNPLAAEGDRRQQAERFLAELIAGEQLWKNPTERRFGQVMIWDVRAQIQDKALLRAAADIYFAGDTISEQFQDINSILNGDSANETISTVRDAVAALEDAEGSFDRFDATVVQRAEFYRTVDATLDAAHAVSGDVLFDVIGNLRRQEVGKRALHYLYTHDIAGKDDTFVNLYIRLEAGTYDIPDIFAGVFPEMFKGPEDPNLDLVRRLLFVPEVDYRNDRAAERGRETATMFFLGTVHWPENFSFFMEMLTDESYNGLAGLKASVFTNLLSKEYDSEINSTLLMDQDQLEVMLETISDVLRKPGWHEYDFFREAIRAIYYLDNPKAKPWMEAHHNNRAWLETFPNVEMTFDPLRYEINDAIEASLEFMSERAAE